MPSHSGGCVALSLWCQRIWPATWACCVFPRIGTFFTAAVGPPLTWAGSHWIYFRPAKDFYLFACCCLCCFLTVDVFQLSFLCVYFRQARDERVLSAVLPRHQMCVIPVLWSCDCQAGTWAPEGPLCSASCSPLWGSSGLRTLPSGSWGLSSRKCGLHLFPHLENLHGNAVMNKAASWKCSNV